MIIEVDGRVVFDSWAINQSVRKAFCRHNWVEHSHYGLRLQAFCDGYEQERVNRVCSKCRKTEFVRYGHKVPFMGNRIPDGR